MIPTSHASPGAWLRPVHPQVGLSEPPAGAAPSFCGAEDKEKGTEEKKKSHRGPKRGETLKSKRLENVQRVPPKSARKKGVWMLVSLARWHASCRLLCLTLASMTGYCIALTSAQWLLN